MKYKRRKTNISKYITKTSNKDTKKVNFMSLKKRITISAFLFTVVFTLTKMNVIDQNTVKKVFKEDDILNKPANYITQNTDFADSVSSKIKLAYKKLLGKEDTSKTNAYAKKEISKQKEDASLEKEDNFASQEKEFNPINPCVGRISSEFGERVHPLNSEVSFHNGIDIAAQEGDEVRACFDGVVEISQYNDYSGNYIIIRHDNGYSSSYAHMSKLLVKEGTKLKTGDIIGLVGSTGAATGPHLHFEIRLENTPLNPEELINAKN